MHANKQLGELLLRDPKIKCYLIFFPAFSDIDIFTNISPDHNLKDASLFTYLKSIY